MLSEGISLIIVDDEQEVARVLQLLGVDEAVPLGDMVKVLDRLYDVVFYEVFEGSMANAEKYLHAYNVRRAIVVHEGKAKAFGRDLNWIKQSLQCKARLVEEGILPPPNLNFVRQPPVWHQQEERDDPYTELGYSRR